MSLKAIIFDVDGTLAETEEIHRTAFNRAFVEAGLAWCWSANDYTALLTTTGGRERICRHMIGTGEHPDPATIAALHTRKNQIYAEIVAVGVTLRPGVAALIEQARRNDIALAIATTTSRSNLVALLDATFRADGLAQFAVVVCGEDVVAKKPNPEVYQRTLAGLDLPASACVAIEDSANGLAAARACGIATIVTPSLYTRHEHFADAALIATSLAGRVDLSTVRAVLDRETQGIG